MASVSLSSPPATSMPKLDAYTAAALALAVLAIILETALLASGVAVPPVFDVTLTACVSFVLGHATGRTNGPPTPPGAP